MSQPIYSLGLTGYPLSHSLSPMLHSVALLEAGLFGEYRLFPIEQRSDNSLGDENQTNPTTIALKFLIMSVRDKQLNGLNVTIPYKQTVVPMLDRLTPAAEAVQAVNTIYLKDGRVWGDNTDITGFTRDLEYFGFISTKPENKPRFSKTHVLVLGAGGSARAVVYALIRLGMLVTIAARRLQQSLMLIQELSHGLVEYPSPRAISLTAADLVNDLRKYPYSIIVNTTPVGMASYSAQNIWPEGVEMPQDCIVYDLIYNPRQTPLLSTAMQSGLQAINGLGMLVEQAAESFDIWTGFRPTRKLLFDAVTQLDGKP